MSAQEILRTLQPIDPWSIFTSLDTPYCKYATSNNVPSDPEIVSIRAIIAERKDQINDIDAIVQRMESLIDQFRQKREQVVSSMEMHTKFVGIRCLPSDVLGEIFVQCLPRDTYMIPRKTTAPLLLTMICRSWREIALDTPRLWSSFRLCRSTELLVRFREWLNKAKACPLSLRVDLIPGRGYDDDDLVWGDAAWEFLRPYNPRITNFTLSFPGPLANQLGRFLDDVPLLETLHIIAFKFPAKTIEHVANPFSRLRTLIISTSLFNIDIFSSVHLGWTNLTRLAVVLWCEGNIDERVLITMLAQLLAMCPNLETFVFAPLCILGSDNPLSLTHAKLRTLKLVICDQKSAHPRAGESVSSLDKFTLPNLRYLQVDRYLDSDSANADTIEDIFILRQDLLDQSPRRTFHMTARYMHYLDSRLPALFTIFNPGWTDLTHIRCDFCCEPGDAVRLLQLCPSLEDIVFSSIFIVDTAQHSTPHTHPVLRSLAIVIHSESELGQVDILLDMLTLPSLCHLKMELPTSPPWSHLKFKEFLSRSQCLLETLKIKGPRVSDEEREELVTLIPTLKRLEVNDAVTQEGDSDTSEDDNVGLGSCDGCCM